jgi:hypothetical protein
MANIEACRQIHGKANIYSMEKGEEGLDKAYDDVVNRIGTGHP